jgi:hypothetical protein
MGMPKTHAPLFDRDRGRHGPVCLVRRCGLDRWERRIAIAQNSRLCGMPDESYFTEAPKKPAKN